MDKQARSGHLVVDPLEVDKKVQLLVFWSGMKLVQEILDLRNRSLPDFDLHGANVFLVRSLHCQDSIAIRNSFKAEWNSKMLLEASFGASTRPRGNMAMLPIR